MDCSEKRAAIIQATLELVSEHGFHGSPVAMVAERAGVAAGTIYRYFESKDVLISAAYADLEERLLKKILEDYPKEGAVREKFSHLARVLVTQWISSPVEFRFLEQFHNSPYGIAHRKEKMLGGNQDLCGKIFAEALEKGLVKEIPFPMFFALVFGPLIYICRDHILGFFTLDDSLLQQAIDGCWNAVKLS
ncbi:MAG TPA: TetR/AcrR family transcriptional regulator [Geomonas sp.]